MMSRGSEIKPKDPTKRISRETRQSREHEQDGACHTVQTRQSREHEPDGA